MTTTAPYWYIRLTTGELIGTFLSEDRARDYIANKIKSGSAQYEDAKVELVT